MANRSYLYAANRGPGSDSGFDKVIGISESSYEIPLVYKILLSGRPRACRSLIWDHPEPISIAGDYKDGLERLSGFLADIRSPDIDVLRTQSMDFLSSTMTRRDLFVLECGEIFEMDDDQSIEAQNLALVEEIMQVELQMAEALKELNGTARSTFARIKAFLVGKPEEGSAQAIERLGLDRWSRDLYFSPSG